MLSSPDAEIVVALWVFSQKRLSAAGKWFVEMRIRFASENSNLDTIISEINNVYLRLFTIYG